MLGYCKLCFCFTRLKVGKTLGPYIQHNKPRLFVKWGLLFFLWPSSRGEVGSSLLMDCSAFIVVFFEPLGGHALSLS